MKFKKTLTWRETFLILAVITVILALLRGPERKRERGILGNPGFVRGQVITYSAPGARGTTNFADYVYWIDSMKSIFLLLIIRFLIRVYLLEIFFS